MDFKTLIIASVLFVTAANAQYKGNDYGMPVPGQCNETLCHFPCEGAAPPPKCPTYMPDCRSGCACFMDCSTDTLICFMTKHCQRRRYITRRRYARAVSQTLDSRSSQALGSMKQNLSLELLSPAGERAKQDLIAIIDQALAVRQNIEKNSETNAVYNIDEKNVLMATNATMAVNQINKRYLPSSSQSQDNIPNEMQNISNTTVASAIGFRAAHDKNFQNIQGNRDWEREYEKAAEKAAEKAQQEEFEKTRKEREKALALAAEKAIKAKSKLGAGMRVVVDTAVVCVVIIACLNRCFISVLPWNI